MLHTCVRALAEESNRNGTRPLVLWSSGCKDCGTTDLYGSPGLAPHGENSSLNAPEILKERTTNCLRIFDDVSLFNAAVIWPTSVFGYSSKGFETLRIPGDPNSIIHATHVDDCAEAYVTIAEHSDRSANGVEFVPASEAKPSFPPLLHLAFSFSQWVRS
ncbi:hypothetical protein LCI18_002186 [Fusarium solani-melongenae]|uniref:Uncharacterized protein n=1 Tax=Fusarium solani subsp. cucurbitae TaxID=2747967 RepID=A0ACD3YRM0_FUSSC|nr:hypothetical protein LCI18_002186 [Fusarium solani-melongenae]